MYRNPRQFIIQQWRRQREEPINGCFINACMFFLSLPFLGFLGAKRIGLKRSENSYLSDLNRCWDTKQNVAYCVYKIQWMVRRNLKWRRPMVFLHVSMLPCWDVTCARTVRVGSGSLFRANEAHPSSANQLLPRTCYTPLRSAPLCPSPSPSPSSWTRLAPAQHRLDLGPIFRPEGFPWWGIRAPGIPPEAGCDKPARRALRSRLWGRRVWVFLEFQGRKKPPSLYAYLTLMVSPLAGVDVSSFYSLLIWRHVSKPKKQ